jgi:hypothetical protein
MREATTRLELWGVAVALVVSMVILLAHAGFNAGPAIASALHSVEHALGEPI